MVCKTFLLSNEAYSMILPPLISQPLLVSKRLLLCNPFFSFWNNLYIIIQPLISINLCYSFLLTWDSSLWKGSQLTFCALRVQLCTNALGGGDNFNCLFCSVNQVWTSRGKVMPSCPKSPPCSGLLLITLLFLLLVCFSSDMKLRSV